MNKNRFKKWVGMLFLLAICILIQSPTTVSADTCSNPAKVYDINFGIKGSGENAEVQVTAKVGRFYIKLLPTDYFSEQKTAEEIERAKLDANYPPINQNAIFVGGAKNATTYTIRSADYKKFANNYGVTSFTVLVYSADDATDQCASKKYSKLQDFSFTSEPAPDPIVSSATYNNSVCSWARDFINSGIDANMRNITVKAMAPCFNTSVSYNMSLQSLKKIQTKLLNFYEGYYKEYSENSNIYGATELPTMNAPWVQVGNTDLSGQYKNLGSSSNTMLTCNTKNEKTYQYLYYDKTEKKTVDITLGDGTNGIKNTETKEACETQCREQIIISYGPPTAVVAGQCFSYEVEIKSKVTCIAKVNFDNFPDFTNYIPCEMRPVCNNIANFTEQAGPNEDFDSCVASCDGGKYSQSCINSCYQKVYENKATTSKTSSTLADVNLSLYRLGTLSIGKAAVTKVANIDEDEVGCPTGNPGSDSSMIGAVYRYVNQHITGNYTVAGAQIVYTPKDSNCKWNKYGYSYFRDMSITARTVCNDAGLNWDVHSPYQCAGSNASSCHTKNGCYPGKVRGNVYQANDKGFKALKTCQQTCTWQNTSRTADGNSCYYIDREAAENAYITNIENYLNTIGGCINTAIDACDKTTSSTYTMTVNKDVTTDSSSQTCDTNNFNSNSNCLSWSSNHDKITKFDNMSLTESSIIKFIGGSCTHASGEDNAQYHTILTFPGAWINNKNGEVTYNKPANEKWYTNYGGNYCTPLNAKNVNAIWWTWYQYQKAGKITQSFEEWAGSKSKDIVYNIYNTVNNFGLYRWKFDTACFYAVNDDAGGEQVPDVTKCTNSECPVKSKDSQNDTSVNNYSSKSISTTTMFPSTKTSSTEKATVQKLSYVDKLANTDNAVASSSTRTQGYNWSVDATNLSIEGYPVTPTSLIKKVESTDTYVESEVDYDITLSRSNISNIKKAYNTRNFSYTSFDDGTYVDVNNGYSEKYKTSGYTDEKIPSYTYYRSSFIRDDKYTSKRNVIPKEGGLSCNNLKSSTSCDLLTEYTSSDNELIDWISKVR